MAHESGSSGVIEISDFARLPEVPVVSVLMLTYKHAQYLAQAIEGVLAQRADFPIELLIADDASPDDTGEIAKRYQRERPDVVRIVTGPANIGARANRRRASRLIRGEFLAFCEGDDYWTDPEKLQRQVDWLRANPKAGAVHTDFDHILMRRGHWRRLVNFQQHRFADAAVPSGIIFETLLRGSFIQTCTFCVRTDIDRKFVSEFLKDSYPVGDWPLSLYVAATHEIGYLPQSTAVYRRIPGSMMNSGYYASARLMAAYIPMMEDVCKRFGLSAAMQHGALLPLHRALFSLAFFAGDTVTFESAVAWLRAQDPAFLAPWQRRLKVRWMGSPLLRCMLVFKHEMRLWIDEWRNYRMDSQRPLKTGP